MKRNVSFLLCFFILMSLSFISLVHGEEVTFPDPNLEAAIREALNKQEGAITDGDLAGLTELDASERGIIDLTGIEYCTNLQTLTLRGNQISDISPLLNNPGIGEGDEIDLRGNQLDIQKLQEKGATIILFDTPELRWRYLHQPLAEQGYITEGLILDPLNPELLDVGNEVGNQAPDFSLPDELENIVTLSDYRGKNNIVLIFHTGST